MKDNQLLFDQTVAASWADDISKSCKVELSLVPTGGQSKTINSGDKLEEAGTLQLRVLDEAGNSSSAEIKLTLSDTKAPEIEVKISEKNVVAGVKISVQDNQLFFDQDVAATWKDDYSETFTTELYLFVDGCEPETINSGDVITKAGVFKIHVTDEFGNKSIGEITLTAVAVYGLENLQGKTLQVDQEVNLLKGITFAEGLTLVIVEVEENGVRTEIANPDAYIPQVSGQVNIIFTLARTDGSTIEVKVDGITVMGITYHALEIIDVFGKDYLPQVEIGDKEVYDHIDHIRVGEAKRVVEMMWQYGAGSHNKEQYQSLMMRLNTGMLGENPTGYDNYEIFG